jgi:glycosyltransferase involved in cell wall biosynthesis
VFLSGFGSGFDQPLLGGYHSCGSLGIARNTISGFAKSLSTALPFSIAKYGSATAQRKLTAIVDSNDFDVIWYEQTQAASASYLAGLLQRRDRKVIHILRSHNVEYRIMNERTNFPYDLRKVLLSIEARKLRKAELEITQLMDHVYAITQEDRDALRCDSPALLKNISYLPIPLELKLFAKTVKWQERKIVLFVANCRWEPNLIAAKWIICRLAPCIQKRLPSLFIRIIGYATENLRRYICTNNIECVGFVSDLQSEYQQAICALAPIRSGGGVNIKVIEALEYGIPVVGTLFAKRGIDLSGYIVAESEDEFSCKIEELAAAPHIASEFSHAINRDLVELKSSIDLLWKKVLHPIIDGHR